MLCALVFFFLPSASCVCLILFFLFICEEMHLHLFCVIEEEDAGESVQPSVKAGL